MTTRARQKPKKADNAQHTADLNRFLTRRGPGEEFGAPTPERVSRSQSRGEDGKLDRNDPRSIKAHVIHNEAGFPTGSFYWRITPIIDGMQSRGTLTQEEADVAAKYMRHYSGSRHKGPATSNYLPSYEASLRDFTPAQRAVHYGNMRRAAEQSVHPFFRPCLRWIEKAAEDDEPLYKLGETYYPREARQTQSNRAVPILHMTISMLASHYGQPHRFQASEIEVAIRRMRVTIEVEERIVRTCG